MGEQSTLTPLVKTIIYAHICREQGQLLESCLPTSWPGQVYSMQLLSYAYFFNSTIVCAESGCIYM